MESRWRSRRKREEESGAAAVSRKSLLRPLSAGPCFPPRCSHLFPPRCPHLSRLFVRSFFGFRCPYRSVLCCSPLHFYFFLLPLLPPPPLTPPALAQCSPSCYAWFGSGRLHPRNLGGRVKAVAGRRHKSRSLFLYVFFLYKESILYHLSIRYSK